MDFTPMISIIKVLVQENQDDKILNEMLNNLYSDGYRDGQESILQDLKDKQ